MKTKANKLYSVLFFTIALFSCKKEYVPYNDPDDFRNRIVGVYDCTDNFGNNYKIEVAKKYTAPTGEFVDTLLLKNLFNQFPVLDFYINKNFLINQDILKAKDYNGNSFTISGNLFPPSTTGYNKFEFLNNLPVIRIKARVSNSYFFQSEQIEYQSKTYEVIGNKIFK